MVFVRKILIIILFLSVLVPFIDAQEPSSETVKITYTMRDDGQAYVTKIENKSEYDISLLLYDYNKFVKTVSIKRNQSYTEAFCCTRIRCRWKRDEESKSDGFELLHTEYKPIQDVQKDNETKNNNKESTANVSGQNSTLTQRSKDDGVTVLPKLSSKEVLIVFHRYLSSIDYYSRSAIDSERTVIENHSKNLHRWEDKETYIKEQGLEDILHSLKDSLESYKSSTATLINKFLSDYDGYKINNKEDFIEKSQEFVNTLLNERESNIELLEDAINDARGGKDSLNWQLIAIIVCVALILVALVIWYKKTNNKNQLAQQRQVPHQVSAAEAASSIVVRRKTTSVLRKQSLEDVMDNDSYLAINCNEFCNDSAVRRIYIKNTCIKDIYNMYAEDLRNPNNPKEDGCMVLGRWVYDKDNNEYYVSLEHVVLPGDDAVFAEYELNFGGKIKLKVTEKLRKLRRDTGLQYDLTCWVHSHPGLGVFFSNSDSNVQMQLKHPTHPNFLTAIVVDILTPQQELGIFTFKKDSSINSKNDLTRMYSLEDLYQWAVESERNAFKSEDYFNTLVNTPSHVVNCYGIELSNGAIIDISRFAIEQTSGFVGMVHGFYNQQGAKTEAVAVTVNASTAVPDNELIGCFVIATHRSLPSIRKAVAPFVDRIKFALVYTTIDGMLTSIPVVNRDLCSDETYYGEQTLEDLKIWTRRKR